MHIPRFENVNSQLKRIREDWAKFKAKQKPPEFQVSYSVKRTIKAKPNALAMFWPKFRSLRTVEGKLALLREMAEIRVDNPVPYPARRRHKHSRRRRKWVCQVCVGVKARHIHHIIQVQHGGRNKKNNLIELCEFCHAAIHPWMVKDVAPLRMKETMARIEREA